MKPRQSSKDKMEGTVRTIKGRLKKAAGDLTGNPDTRDEGTAEEFVGRAQKKLGEVERVFEKD